MAPPVIVSSPSTAGPSRLVNDQALHLGPPGYAALTPNRLQGIRVIVSTESVELPEPKRQAVRPFGRGGRGSKPGVAAAPISEVDVQGSAAHQVPPLPQPSITAASATGTDSRVFGRGGLGPRRPRHVDPKPLPTPEELRAQMASGVQGSNKVRRTGRGGAGSVPVGLKGKEPNPSTKGEISPSPSTASLKLKLMHRPKFKGLLVGRSGGSNDSLSPSHSPSSPRSLSLRSPSFLAPRSRFSSDTITTSSGIGSDNGSYFIPNQPPNSEVATTVRSYSPPLSATSTWSTHEEEGIPLTPITTRSGTTRPGSPGDSDFLRQTNYVLGGVPSTVIRSAEFSNIRTRGFPTATQDDLSLDLQTLASKRESLNRINRRASVSVTSMLSSSSSSSPTPSNLPNPSFLIDDADNKDRYPGQSNSTSMDPGHRGESSSTALLPPMGVDDGSSLEVTANLSPPIAHDNDDDNIVTPTSRRQNTPFVSSRSSDPRSEDHPHSPGTRSRSHSHSRSASRASSSEAWHARPDTPFLDRPPHIQEPEDGLSPAQVQTQKRQVEIEIAGQVSGPAFISRYEPKQGWVGVWNRGDMEDVIDTLRELRSPKGPY